jgi:putative hydrolase of the HAD superfamily
MPAPERAIRAVIFDLDDTLYRERDYVRSGFAAVSKHLGRGPRLGRWMWRRFLAGRREKMFDALNRHFRLGLTRGQVLDLVALYRGHVPSLRPCQGVVALLRRLRRRRMRLGLLSDGRQPAQRLKLSALGVEGLFDAVVFTEDLGREAWKPSPAGYELIRRRLAAGHGGCAYVADNPAKDFLAPNRLGWLTVQWRRPGQVHADNPPPPGGRPQRVIRSGPELLRLLLGPRRGKT